MLFPDSQRVVMPPILVFDIETVPDTDGLHTLYRTGDSATPQQLAEIAFLQRRQATGSNFLRLHLRRVVAISCALRREREYLTVRPQSRTKSTRPNEANHPRNCTSKTQIHNQKG